jgi:putative chitinase
MIIPDDLQQFAPLVADAAGTAVALEPARLASTVNTPRRLACFMGQIFVESAGFTRMEENLHYTHPDRLAALFPRSIKCTADAAALIAQGPEAIANRVYANKLGNGDEASGDGWRYRGSGYIQLTGRDNFQHFGDILQMDLVNQPELVRQPSGAAAVAFAFWDDRGCSPLADNLDVEGITKKVNGPAMAGLDDRQQATTQARNIWPG